ncbi:MAG: MFS transporter [Actinomycetota bacterium]
MRHDRGSGRGLTEETLFEHGPPPGAPLPPRLLTNRPFLWLMISSGVANLGFWAYFGAVWADAAYRFDASPAQMSILLASFSGPFVLLVPLQGILVDRWSPKWLFVIGDVVSIVAVPLAWSAGSIGMLYASSFAIGVGMCSIIPARSALTGLLVDEDRLVQANGTIAAAAQVSLIVGPLVGGLTTRSVGTGPLYATVLVVLVAAIGLATIVPDRRQGGERPALSFRELADGIATSWRLPELRLLFSLWGVAWLVVNVYWILQPLFVKESLHLGGDVVQFLWSAQGVGSLAGSIVLARLTRGAGRELRLIVGGLVATGLGLLVFAGWSGAATAVVGSIVYGGGFAFFFSSSLALIQRVAGEEKRGRVTSVFAMVQEGTAIVAGIGMIALGDLVVVRPGMIGSGAILVVVAVFGAGALVRRVAVRPPAKVSAGTPVDVADG